MKPRDWQLDLESVSGKKGEVKQMTGRCSGCFFLGEILLIDKPELIRVNSMVAGVKMISTGVNEPLEFREVDKRTARLDRWLEPLWPGDEVSLSVEFLGDGTVHATIFGAAATTEAIFPQVGAAFAERIAQTKDLREKKA